MQVKATEYTSIHRIMKTKAFNLGFEDVRNKTPFRYDYFDCDIEAWAYEWGRQFAMHYIGPLKSGRRICLAAEMMMNSMVRSELIK
jgi:hypothetical protein